MTANDANPMNQRGQRIALTVRVEAFVPMAFPLDHRDTQELYRRSFGDFVDEMLERAAAGDDRLWRQCVEVNVTEEVNS